MNIAILGGGLTGLTAAYYLSKKNHQVTVIEKENILGGMASGFKEQNWNWFLEKTVHHLFSNDKDILDFAKETGFNQIFFESPETASLYTSSKLKTQNSKPQLKNQKLLIFPLDTAIDLMSFPLLGFIDKLRAGIVLAFLKLSPLLGLFESITAEQFLIKSMGKRNWEILWQELFRKKFGKYAGNILASFIWARVKKRTKKLGYINRGFQSFIDYLENKLRNSQIKILKNFEIKKIKKQGSKFNVDGGLFDVVISTLPTPVLANVASDVFSNDYSHKLKKINYLHALSLILETDKPLLPKTYWLNIASKKIPIMGIFQQTNFIDKKYYGGKNILYCGWYVGIDDKLWSMNEDGIVNYILPYLNKISNVKYQISKTRLFKAMYAQPIFDKEFLKNKPEIVTPVENFFIANLEMTYPYDRGTNFAVRLGKQVAELL